MAVKREKVHFETVEELLGAPIEGCHNRGSY